MKVAVIGSGIAGLSAAWYLGERHRVTLYERRSRPGFDAHTVGVEGDGVEVRINIPMRVFFRAYYPTLVELYDELGLAHEPTPYAASFGDLGGATYFRYRNHRLGPFAVPFLAGASARTPTALRLGVEILRFFRRSGQDLARGSLDAITIDEYLARSGYSTLFAERFLYPALAGICTCTYERLRAYPASILLEYLNSGLLTSNVRRLVDGTEQAAARLLERVHELRCGAGVEALTPVEHGLEVVEGGGRREHFDHVVVATQANHGLGLLDSTSSRERRALAAFSYERSDVVVHRDEALAPRDCREWAPVNFLLSDRHDKPMATIVMNRIHPELRDRPGVFETWNPITDISPSRILGEASFERPVIDLTALEAQRQLERLHGEPDRRLWFCGSYVRRGIPLLEAAVASAKHAAERIALSAR